MRRRASKEGRGLLSTNHEKGKNLSMRRQAKKGPDRFSVERGSHVKKASRKPKMLSAEGGKKHEALPKGERRGGISAEKVDTSHTY